MDHSAPTLEPGAPLEAHLERVPVDYDRQWAGLEDYIRFHPGARHRRRLMLGMLRGKRFESVLDVGCGRGEGLLAVRAAFPGLRSLCGVDLAGDLILENRRRMPELEFAELDIERGALARRFELVVCSEVLEHLANRAAAFQHLSRMVSERGYLLLTWPLGPVFATERHFGHLTHPSFAELQALASKHGFEQLAAIEWGFPTYRALKQLTNLAPAWALQNFANGRYGFVKRALNHVLYAACFADLRLAGAGCQALLLLQKR